jgi:hypothetical protein
MQSGIVSRKNVERVAAHIVANELEFHGFRVTDLNKGGISENADLLAARDGKCLQIQVKGASQNKNNKGWEKWWVQYGYGNSDTVGKKKPVFNQVSGFYRADIIALVAVRTPTEYCCVVLPVTEAEKAAQINLDRDYRTTTLKGALRQPHMIQVWLDHIPKFKDPARSPLLAQELKILSAYRDKWNL